MALFKAIKQPNGVVTNYHRILFVQSTINSHISISVISYIDEEGRKSDIGDCEPYKISITYEKPYEENITIGQAYTYLKTLPEFNGAEDV